MAIALAGPVAGKQTSSYFFAGLSITIAGDSSLSAAIERRLRPLRTSGPAQAGLSFDYGAAPSGGGHSIPLGTGRRILDFGCGEVLYDDARDTLLLDYADRIRAECHPEPGTVRVSIVDQQPDDIGILSHSVFGLMLVEMLKRRGLYSLHAAVLAIDGRGIVLPASSGSGKSTLALALARAGFGLLSDDTVFLSPTADNRVDIVGFPDEIDVTDDTARLFPELSFLVDRPKRPGRPKHGVRAEDIYGQPLVPGCQPAVLVFPRFTGAAKSAIRPMSRAEAFVELVPNVLMTESKASQAHLDALSRLANGHPCYRLETGRDLDTVPALLEALIA